MTHTTDQERAEFEAWAQSQWRGINLAWMPDFSKYADLDTNTMWIAWQVARRTPASQARVPLSAEAARHIEALTEIARMPNAEYVADAHNNAVRYLRGITQEKQG